MTQSGLRSMPTLVISAMRGYAMGVRMEDKHGGLEANVGDGNFALTRLRSGQCYGRLWFWISQNTKRKLCDERGRDLSSG